MPKIYLGFGRGIEIIKEMKYRVLKQEYIK